MNCWICEQSISEIHVGPDLKPLECSECQEIIRETLFELEGDEDDELSAPD